METFKGHINGQEFNSREEFEKALSALMKSDQDINIKIEEEKCNCNENDCQCKCKQPEQTFEFLTPEDAQKGLALLARIFGVAFTPNQVQQTPKTPKYEIPNVKTILEKLFADDGLAEIKYEDHDETLDKVSAILKKRVEYFSEETGKLYGFYKANKLSEIDYEAIFNYLQQDIEQRKQVYIECSDEAYNALSDLSDQLNGVKNLEATLNLIGVEMTEEITTKINEKQKELEKKVSEKEFAQDFHDLFVDFASELLEIIENSQLV